MLKRSQTHPLSGSSILCSQSGNRIRGTRLEDDNRTTGPSIPGQNIMQHLLRQLHYQSFRTYPGLSSSLLHRQCPEEMIMTLASALLMSHDYWVIKKIALIDCQKAKYFLFSLFSRSELSYIVKRHQTDGLYCEWSLTTIYFIMIPVIICFVQDDGKLEVDRVFEARALYYVLQLTVLWNISENIHILSEAWISCQRVKVLVISECMGNTLLLLFSVVVLISFGDAEDAEMFPDASFCWDHVINVRFPDRKLNPEHPTQR